MYNENYCRVAREIPLVAFYKKIPTTSLKEQCYMFTDPHYHKDTEVILIESGEGSFLINGCRYQFGPGNIFFINPYELHASEAETECELSYYCIDFDMNMLSQFPIAEKYVHQERNMLHFCDHSSAMEKEIRHIWYAYEENQNGWAMEAIGHLFLLMAQIEQQKLFCAAEKQSMFAREVYDYVEQEYIGKLTSKNAAAYFKYHHSYFCRMFKKHFGVSFGQFLSDYRIKKARQMMENGASKITDIAGAVGFNGISYFSECFLKTTGMTPSQYVSLCKK